MQQFLLPDQTPPILEAEMALRSEQQLISTRQNILSPDPANKQETRQEVTPEPQRPQQQDVRSERNKKTPQAEQKKARTEEVKQVGKKEEVKQQLGKKEEVKLVEKREEPEGRQADTRITEHDRKEVSVHVVAMLM